MIPAFEPSFRLSFRRAAFSIKELIAGFADANINITVDTLVERRDNRNGRIIGGMWICIRCKTEFAEFMTEAEPNLDDFGLHFICPACGRRNRLRSLGRDEDGLIRLEQIDEPE